MQRCWLAHRVFANGLPRTKERLCVFLVCGDGAAPATSILRLSERPSCTHKAVPKRPSGGLHKMKIGASLKLKRFSVLAVALLLASTEAFASCIVDADRRS